MEISSNFELKTKFDFPALLCQCGVAEVVANPRWPPRTSVGKQERATSPAPAALAGGDEVDFFAVFSGFLGSVMKVLGSWACQGASGGLDKELGGLGLQVFPPPHTHSDDQLLRNSSSPKESIFIIDIKDMTIVNIDSV